MSTAKKVTEAKRPPQDAVEAKKAPQRRPGEASGGSKAPVKEANVPRASLLDVYFGDGAKKKTAEVEATKKPSRLAGKRPPAAETPAVTPSRPAAELARRSRPGAEPAQRAGGETAARPKPAQEPAAARSGADQQPMPERPAAETPERPVQTPAAGRPAPERPAAERQPAGQTSAPPRPAARTGTARPAAEVRRPAEQRPGPGAGAKPVVRSEAKPVTRSAAEVRPAPAPIFVPRAVAPSSPPPQIIVRQAPPPEAARPVRPARPDERGPARGADRGPARGDRGPARPGDRPGRPGRPAGGRGRPLAIPKVDPKVAEQQKAEQAKRPIQPGVDKRRDRSDVDDFGRRSERAPEEKLFLRRPGGRGATVQRRASKTQISLDGPVTVKELAHEMGITAAEVIKKLLTLGMLVTINQELDPDTAQIVGSEFGVAVEIKQPELDLSEFDRIDDPDEAAEAKQPRPPVVVIMGHVDHGKTTLLDAIRETRVAAGEAGGITQHIGAYQTEIHGKRITFLDTPGHEAFTAMRARGAQVTDIAVLVVAADDGVMPQTVEAINHAKAAGVPIIVAINKMDKADANPDRVKTELTQHGLVVEEWGGDVIAVPVSAKQKQNLDLLLENILLVAEVQEYKANADKEARGTILEAQLDKGRGPVGTVLVQAGTLEVGDTFVCGSTWGRVRAMFDDRGRRVKKAPPSTPVQVLGFSEVPEAGDIFRAVSDERLAKEVAQRRALAKRAQEQQSTRTSLEDFMSRVKEGEMKDLNIIIKGDVMGSVEAVRGALEKLENEEVRCRVIHGAVGAVSESDVMLAATSGAIIIAFNVRPDERAVQAARTQNVDIRTHRVIYEIVDEVKAAMTGMLAPKYEEVVLGKAEVRAIFKVPRVGNVAGCQALEGKIERNARARLLRDNTVVWEGEFGSLKRFKDDVREVTAGQECGIGLDGFNDIKEGDIIEAFVVREIKPGA